MKTFKLKSLAILEEANNFKTERPIECIDGLVIDREDDKDYWLIEAYMTKENFTMFQSLAVADDIFIKVKISKESNDPAYFMTEIIKHTEIKDNFNVLLIGKLIKSQTQDISTWLHELRAKGFHGKGLITKLKQSF